MIIIFNFVLMSSYVKIINCKDCKRHCTSVFSDLDDKLLKYINQDKDSLLFKKGQYIFTEGARSRGLYCIRSGKVKIHKFGLEKNQIVRTAYRSDIIGYRALISNELYTATAEALIDTEACYISKKVFFNLIDMDKDFTMKLMRILSLDVKTAERNAMNIAQRTVMERLAGYLIERYDSTSADSFYFTRKDLSDIIGCAPETIIRTLSSLKNDEIIKYVNKKIALVDVQRLKRIANNNYK